MPRFSPISSASRTGDIPSASSTTLVDDTIGKRSRWLAGCSTARPPSSPERRAGSGDRPRSLSQAPGAQLALGARRVDRLEASRRRASGQGPSRRGARRDGRCKQRGVRRSEAVEALGGRIDILVNNAGLALGRARGGRERSRRRPNHARDERARADADESALRSPHGGLAGAHRQPRLLGGPRGLPLRLGLRRLQVGRPRPDGDAPQGARRPDSRDDRRSRDGGRHRVLGRAVQGRPREEGRGLRGRPTTSLPTTSRTASSGR